MGPLEAQTPDSMLMNIGHIIFLTSHILFEDFRNTFSNVPDLYEQTRTVTAQKQ